MVRFALIGSNFVVDWFVEAGKRVSGFGVKGVYSRTMERAKEFGIKHGTELFYDDLDKLAACDQIDAVYIACPNYLHKEYAIKMLKAKKHVFCEKPAGVNVRELDEMVKTAKENGVIFMEGMRIVLTPNFSIIRDSLPKLGKLHRATLPYCQYSSRYDKFKMGIIENAFNPKMCNGSLMDIGIYPASLMTELFGPGKVVGAKGIILSNGLDGAGTAIVDYGDLQVEIIYSKIANGYNQCEFQGEDGYLLVKDLNNARTGKICYRDGSEEDLQLAFYENDMNYEIDVFIKLVETGGSPDAYNERSRNAILVLDQIRNILGIKFPND